MVFVKWAKPISFFTGFTRQNMKFHYYSVWSNKERDSFWEFYIIKTTLFVLSANTNTLPLSPVLNNPARLYMPVNFPCVKRICEFVAEVQELQSASTWDAFVGRIREEEAEEAWQKSNSQWEEWRRTIKLL